MLAINLLFIKIYKIPGQISQEFLGLRIRNFRVLSLYKHKHIGRFSNQHWFTFKKLQGFHRRVR